MTSRIIKMYNVPIRNLCSIVGIQMWANQRLLGYYRSQPVQVQAFKSHQSDHGGLFVLIGRVRCCLWVHQADGGAWPSVSLKSRDWSIIHPGNRHKPPKFQELHQNRTLFQQIQRRAWCCQWNSTKHLIRAATKFQFREICKIKRVLKT